VDRFPIYAQGSFVNFEGKQANPIRLSPSTNRLFAVNTPDARLSVFDLSNPGHPILLAEIPVGLEPVSVNPLDDDEAWVVNEVSDSVSVVSVSQHMVTDTIRVPDEPADVVFANGRAFISASRNNRIIVVDLATHAIVTNIAVFGENPRALAVSRDGSRVYAAFALSGNRTTILPPDRAPAPPAPVNPDLPPAPQVSLIVDANDARIPYSMPDNDVVEIDTETLEIVRYFPGVGAVNLGLAVHPMNGDLWVANTDARNLVRFEPALRGNFVSNRVSRVSIGDGAVRHFDLNPGFTYQGFPNFNELSNALAQPTAIAFGRSGNNFFVASFGTDRVALVSTMNGQIQGRIDLNPEATGPGANPRTKRGPRGLALIPGSILYVLNRVSNTITLIDTLNRSVLFEMPVGSHDPTPPFVREGRGFLYDAKLSGSGTVSCSSCHIDAEMDLLAWDLGDPNGEMTPNMITLAPGFPSIPGSVHPMKGPMTTQTLRGLKGLDPLHWRGDRTNFTHFNGAFDTLLGGGLLSDEDMQAYRDFINTVVFQPNPNQNLDRSFPTAFPTKNGIGNAAAGRNTFINEAYQPSFNLRCNTCHVIPTGGSSVIVAAAALEESQDFKVPHLRNVYQKLNVDFASGGQSRSGYGIIHDGIDPDLFTFLSREVFGTFAEDTVRKRNLDAFVQCFDTGMAPAVGYGRTISSTTLADSAVAADWTLLEEQVEAGNIDLIAKGKIGGWEHGLVYDPLSNTYRTDRAEVGAVTREDLESGIAGGDVLTLMGVPPGSGTRLGVDRNEDGVLDGNETAPDLRIVHHGSQAIISWSAEGTGFRLERASEIPADDWQPDLSPRGLADDRITVTNDLSDTGVFFRLRSL
jgi:YVTN family beta-propeller protein